MVELVLFDIDGTLVRTGGAGIEAFRKVFAAEFQAMDGFEKLKFAGRTDTGLVREFFEYHKVPITRENTERFFEHYVFLLDYILSQGAPRPCEGVLEFLAALNALPAPPVIGLLTGNIRLGAEIKLRHCGLWEPFEMGAFADDSEDRNYIAVAARERGSRLLGRKLRGDQIVVIGDTAHDVRCGRFIGAKVLAVATGGATLDELKSHQPDWAVENLFSVTAQEVVSP
ncbi:MAG TPA: HAD family hydrolase [Candidatus Sulfotelmatobacter sp.]|nr:HAD family hydrolase [Candidatus Sulfotelmatobacter sp.]